MLHRDIDKGAPESGTARICRGITVEGRLLRITDSSERPFGIICSHRDRSICMNHNPASGMKEIVVPVID